MFTFGIFIKSYRMLIQNSSDMLLFSSFVFLVKGVNFFGPCSEYIVSGSDCSHVFIWDKKTEEVVTFLQGDSVGVVCTYFFLLFLYISFISIFKHFYTFL